MLKALTVTEFNTYIKGVLGMEDMLRGVEIRGEVSGVSVSGAHAYFTLKDENAQVCCNVFSYKKTLLPKNGDRIAARGSVDYYVKGGRLSFNVDRITLDGVGRLHLLIEELKQKLLKQGIFDSSHKKPIPKYPKNVCVVTSKSGAVIRDIITTVRQTNLSVNITVKDVRVQGEDADRDIVKALGAVDKLGFDAVILARGGGSLEDLINFYKESVVLAVYNMNTPIISAIGHETDFALCDLAADYRAATPTAAAQLIAYDEIRTRQDVLLLLRRLRTAAERRYASVSDKIISSVMGMTSAVRGRICLSESILYRKTDNLVTSIREAYSKKEAKFYKLAAIIEHSNPMRLMGIGYHKITKDGKNVSDLKELRIRDRVLIHGAGAEATAMIEEVKHERF